MSHTKRIYHNPNYNGPYKWYFLGWRRDKPWKVLSNKIIIFHKDMGVTKRLMQKRQRQLNKIEIKQIKDNCLNRKDLEWESSDPLSHLVPIYDDYLNYLNPCYSDDY